MRDGPGFLLLCFILPFVFIHYGLVRMHIFRCMWCRIFTVCLPTPNDILAQLTDCRLCFVKSLTLLGVRMLLRIQWFAQLIVWALLYRRCKSRWNLYMKILFWLRHPVRRLGRALCANAGIMDHCKKYLTSSDRLIICGQISWKLPVKRHISPPPNQHSSKQRK